MVSGLETIARSDEAIREDVVSELKWDPNVVATDIGVAVKDGVVTLSGFVPKYWSKEEAEKAAKRVLGVRGVANDIEVKLSATRTDPEIACDAVHELESHVSIPAERIKVTVEAGWITLEGTADWQYQKDLAESAVRSLKGVIGVSNVIEVKPSVSCRDQEQDRRSPQAKRRAGRPANHGGGGRRHSETQWNGSVLVRARTGRARRVVGSRNVSGRERHYGHFIVSLPAALIGLGGALSGARYHLPAPGSAPFFDDYENRIQTDCC